MKSRTSELAVGGFVVIFAVALFFLAMKVSGLMGNNMKDSYVMSATFDNVNGLKERAKVTMSGVKIGQVQNITLDPVTRQATVKFVLDGSLTSFNAEQMKKVQENTLGDLRYSADYQAATPEQQSEAAAMLRAMVEEAVEECRQALRREYEQQQTADRHLAAWLRGDAGGPPLLTLMQGAA